MKAAQVGLTEGGITIGLFVADYHGRDVIYYFPSKKMAHRFSQTRIAQAINLSDYLSRSCTNNSAELKQFGNATIHVLGASSMADLKGTSSGRLVFDELDEWTERQIYLAEERASGQKDDDVIIWGFSTPSYPGRGIHKQISKSTEEHFFFDCPHCGDPITFGFLNEKDSWRECLEIFGDSQDATEVFDSYLKCWRCEKRLEHKDKTVYLQSGRWASMDENRDPIAPDPHLFKVSRGFYLPQLYSPTVEPYRMAIKYLRGYVSGDEDARREFHNSCLALPFLEDGYQLTDEEIETAITSGNGYKRERPTSADKCMVTLGVDQGGPVHNWVAVDWSIDAKKTGDPNDRATGKVIGFGEILADHWSEVYDLMRLYQVRMCVVDYFPQPTDARIFARRFSGHVYLCQYNTGPGGLREIRLTEDTYGANLVKCDKVGWLSKTLSRIRNGTMLLPADSTIEFRRQLQAPIRRLKMVGNQYVAEFIETGPDHYAHAMNYAEVALKILDPDLHSDSFIRS